MTALLIQLPDPSLVVLIGAAGAGKSTFARRWFSRDEILSSDAIRAELGRGEDDQRVSRVAFEVLHARLTARLASDLLTVVDATNIQASARRALLARRPDPGVPAVAIVLETDLDVVHARNRTRRSRVVPTAVVDRQLSGLDRVSDEHLVREGFAAIHRVPDTTRAQIARVDIPD